MSKWQWLTIFLLVPFNPMACVSTGVTSSVLSYDEKPTLIATLDLFSQEEAPRSGKTWVGDWEFRRDRLELVDTALRDLRADIFVMQNSMRRIGSASESDELILRAGALSRYEWRDRVFRVLEESGEDRLLAVAVHKPHVVAPVDSSSKQSIWQLGSDGAMALFEVVMDHDPILVVNVLMPSQKEESNLWYSFLEERIAERLKSGQACPERVVIAGMMPVDQDSKRINDFMSHLELKDTSTGFCQNIERCETATSANGLYLVTRGDEKRGQIDRIFVHKMTQVNASTVVFNQSVDRSRYHESYGLSKIWPAQRYGWSSLVHLPKCSPKK